MLKQKYPNRLNEIRVYPSREYILGQVKESVDSFMKYFSSQKIDYDYFDQKICNNGGVDATGVIHQLRLYGMSLIDSTHLYSFIEWKKVFVGDICKTLEDYKLSYRDCSWLAYDIWRMIALYKEPGIVGRLNVDMEYYAYRNLPLFSRLKTRIKDYFEIRKLKEEYRKSRTIFDDSFNLIKHVDYI